MTLPVSAFLRCPQLEESHDALCMMHGSLLPTYFRLGSYTSVEETFFQDRCIYEKLTSADTELQSFRIFFAGG